MWPDGHVLNLSTYIVPTGLFFSSEIQTMTNNEGLQA